MRYPIHIAACTLLMIACCSGIAFSQFVGDSDNKEFNDAFYAELQTSEDAMKQFGESLQPLFIDMQLRVQARAQAEVPQRMANMSPPPASM